MGLSRRSEEIVQRREMTMIKGVKLELGGHLIKAVGDQLKQNRSKHVFSQQVVNIWNLLPQEAVEMGQSLGSKRR